ncbi:MAG: DUF4124 domain-containing protein [Gammaproteobacteria bacterium]|nr:DUF4124 domain-containing protein [Gammaproteobacteria bacterium]
MRWLTLFCFLIASTVFAGDIYKEVLPDGRVIYSDRPGKESVEMRIEPLQTVKPPPRRVEQSRAMEVKPQQSPAPAPTYEELRLVSPAKDASVRENSGRVTVKVELSPELQVQSGHRLAVELDGTRLAGRFTGQQMELSNVDRGSHELAVVILDPSGNVIRRTQTHRFHLHRHSQLFTQ